MSTLDCVSRTVESFLSDWAQIVHLYTIVHDLSEYLQNGKIMFRDLFLETSHSFFRQTFIIEYVWYQVLQLQQVNFMLWSR